MALEDYQRSFNGLTIGPFTGYELMEETGLEGFEIRSGIRPLPREDGSIPGLHLVDSKTAILPMEIAGDPETEITPLMQAALKAFTPQRDRQFKYTFKNPGEDEQFVWARPLRVKRDRTVTGALGVDTLVVALEIADPRIYSSALHTIVVPEFDASGGGFDFPANFPINMSAATQQLGVANNAGTRDAYPRLVFQYQSGTVNGVELSNLSNGDVIDIDTEIVAGQQLIADMDALVRATGGQVVSIGLSSRYGDWQLPRDPFRLQPGDNNLKLVTTGGGTVTCAVSWRDTN